MSTSRHRSVAGQRHTSGGGLALRQLVADPWVSVLLAVLVLVVAGAATVWPRVVLEINTRQIPHVLEGLSSLQRDPAAVRSTTTTPDFRFAYASVEETWGELIQGLDQARTAQPEPLRSLLGEGQFFVDVASDRGEGPPPAPTEPIAQAVLSLRVDPFLRDHVELVRGDWPELVIPFTGDGSYTVSPEEAVEGAPEPEGIGEGPPQVLVLDSTARTWGWEVGTEFDGLLLAGTYAPVDPEDARWEQAPNGAELGRFFDGDLGLLTYAAAYLPPENPGTVGRTTNNTLRFFFELDAEAVRGDQVAEIATQLLGLTSSSYPLRGQPEATEGGPVAVALPIDAVFTAEVVTTFQTLAEQQRATASVLAVVAAGPVGVTLAAFALAARLVVDRRRTALALALARGGSPWQLRGALALEGLLLGLPPAVAGYALAGLVVPTSSGRDELAVALLVGLVPAAVLALSTSDRSLRERRRDLGARSRSRVRWIVEVVVVAGAAVASWRLLDRGLTGVSTGAAAATPGGGAPGTTAGRAPPMFDTGVDPLMAATPVLLALAACVLTLRLYPVPVRLLVRFFRGRTGLTSFLGAARAVRDPAGGLVPALAVVLGVAVAVSSSVMASTITRGAEAAAWDDTGAQIRLSGPQVTDELRAAVADVDGVMATAGISDWGTTDLTGSVTVRGATVYVVDGELQEVQAAAPLVVALPTGLFSGDDSAIPVVLGGEVPETTGDVIVEELLDTRVVGRTEGVSGLRTDRNFLLVERSRWEAAGQAFRPGSVLLVAVEPGADTEQVADRVREAVPNSLVQTPQARLDRFREAPVSHGLSQLFLAAVVLAALLTVLTVVLVQLLGAPSRTALFAVLRTLGIAPGQSRAVTAWELAPLLAMACLTGAVTGLVVPWLLLRAVDLTGVTGGARQPALVVDAVVLGPVVATVVAAVALAVLASAWVAGRSDLARQLRIGQEG